jgi:2-polyprenyl-6-methoxyphenol hydroxylase-like FAD-dependent oxidoreductase
MKVIIVGGGIAGLSVYLHLCKHVPSSSEHDITIYELPRPHLSASSSSLQGRLNYSVNLDALFESTTMVGDGLGIAPNDMRVLRNLGLNLYDRIVAQEFPAEMFIFRRANGWTLGMQSTSNKPVRLEGEAEGVCIASSRHGLWHTGLR